MAGGETSTGADEPEVYAVFDFEFAVDNGVFSDWELQIEVVGSSGDAPRFGADAVSGKRGREEAEGTSILRVNTIYICSVILAARSPFFRKLFSNGTKESYQRHATLRIADSEENAFMEVVRFMYSGKLEPTTDPTILVDILMAADKFDVGPCMKLCGQRLMGMPMTPESAVLCLDLPGSISMAADLTEAAKKFLAERYKQFLSAEFQEELMTVPLAGIVAILSSNHPGAVSQEDVYRFILRWADLWYPNSEERYKILSSRLIPLA